MSTIYEQIFLGPAEGTPLSGTTLRDWGIEDAFQRCQRIKGEYVTKCLAAIESFPVGALLTSEDVREKAGDPPSEVDRSVLAGIMKHAKSKGLLVITGEKRAAKRPSVHSKDLSLWRRV